MKRLAMVAVCLLFLIPVAASAQSATSELGIFASTSQWDNTSDTDEDGETVNLEFDEDMGYGVTYNRFWGPAFSTEFGYQQLSANMRIGVAGGPTFEFGNMDLSVLSGTGQFHFARSSRVSPYIGAGFAYVTGEAEIDDGETIETADLENETTWLANAGVNIGVTQSLSIAVDAKYIPYEARAEDDPEDPGLDVNPLVLSAGIRWRF